ncbi:MAG: hypothetical protein MJE66_10035, partial [Proteobacteria bacterium]|nr:hypothetical protein [Pseudomonadota bacterium]
AGPDGDRPMSRSDSATAVWPAREGTAGRASAHAHPWRNRIGTGFVCLAAVLLSRAAFPDEAERQQFLYAAVITIGYGHLIGAVAFTRMRRHSEAHRDSPLEWTAFWLVGLATSFCAYAWLLQAHPVVLLPLLAISTWHTIENDLALGRAYRAGFRMPGVSRSLLDHTACFGLTAAISALSMVSLGASAWFPGGRWLELVSQGVAFVCGAFLLWRRGYRLLGGATLACVLASVVVGPVIRFADVFVCSTLYHLVSWLWYLHERAASEGGARALWVRLAWLHALPAAVCVGVWTASGPLVDPLRSAVFGPGIYLFWSVAHVIQTAVARGFSRADAL